jgi:hypothetical protein
VNLNVDVGPIGIAIENGTLTLNDGSADPTKEAAFSFGLAAGQHSLASLSPSDFQATLKGGASLSLPLYLEPGDTPLGGANMNILSITIPDLNALLAGNPNTVQITTPDLSNLLSNVSVLGLLQNPSAFVGDMEQLLNLLQSALDSKVFSVNLPLLGNDLQNAAHFLSDLVMHADAGLKTLSTTLQYDTEQQLIGDLQQGMVNIFGPSGLGLLEDANGMPATPATALSDVAIHYVDAQGNDLGAASLPVPSNADAIQIYLKLGSDLVISNFGVSSSLGLPGLGISSSGNIRVEIPWTFNFGFGFSQHDGFCLNTSPAVSPTFDVGLHVTAARAT